MLAGARDPERDLPRPERGHLIERSFAWIGRDRRLGKDLEAGVPAAEAFSYAAAVVVLARRRARASRVTDRAIADGRGSPGPRRGRRSGCRLAVTITARAHHAPICPSGSNVALGRRYRDAAPAINRQAKPDLDVHAERNTAADPRAIESGP